MKPRSTSEVVIVKEVARASSQVSAATRGLSIGSLIKSIRIQLGMSQAVLAKRADVPQSTVSRVERGVREVTLSTLNKILEAISCDLVVAPMLQEPVEVLRRKQARKKAENHACYIKGTMNLEDQQPDSLFIEELIRQEEERLLQSLNTNLWEE